MKIENQAISFCNNKYLWRQQTNSTHKLGLGRVWSGSKENVMFKSNPIHKSSIRTWLGLELTFKLHFQAPAHQIDIMFKIYLKIVLRSNLNYNLKIYIKNWYSIHQNNLKKKVTILNFVSTLLYSVTLTCNLKYYRFILILCYIYMIYYTNFHIVGWIGLDLSSEITSKPNPLHLQGYMRLDRAGLICKYVFKPNP